MNQRWLDIILFFTPLFCFTTWANEIRSCAETAQELKEMGIGRGLEVQTLISGEHLRICHQEYTCCSRQTEQRLSQQSMQDLVHIVNESVSYPLGVLTGGRKKFHEFFLALLTSSEQSLASMFSLSYGYLYTQNAALFTALFSEIRSYYMGGEASRLADSFSEFWAGLMERTLRLLLPHYQLNADYMECAVRSAEELQAFGDIPQRLQLQITRALGAARTLVLGLATGSNIVNRAAKALPTPDCLHATMRMWYCPLCRGYSSLRPCHGLCLNVMKGCLAFQADMDSDWNSLIEGLQEVAERLAGSFNVELATESIGVKISEAIMTLQEENVRLTTQIFNSCGIPPPTRYTRSPQEQPKRKFHVYSNEEKPTSAAGTNIDRLVSEIIAKLRPLQGLWKLLPLSLCSDQKVSAGLSNQDKCWNGQSRGRYLPPVTGDGLISQINNPELEVDMSPSDPKTRHLGLQLRVARSKLRAAYSGKDSDTQESYDDSSSSGGGETVTDKPLISTQTAETVQKEHPLKPKKKNKKEKDSKKERTWYNRANAYDPLLNPLCQFSSPSSVDFRVESFLMDLGGSFDN
ncbi:glypican-2 [Bombina bombina]|uniref:glypican-2 n=1 Tax=Bombina bombina TaxID=8345 RepID=UPI00235A5C5D|nr:glypican-2 [Bombina bombina]